jgi:hypothetical protein
MKKSSLITVFDDVKLITSFTRYPVKQNTTLIVPEYYQANIVCPEETKTLLPGQEILFPKEVSKWENLLYWLRVKKEPTYLCDIHFINMSLELNHAFDANDLELYVFDPTLRMPVELKIKGYFSIKLKSLQKLFEANGKSASITALSIYQQFKPVIFTELKHQVSIYTLDESFNVMHCESMLKPLSNKMYTEMKNAFESIGVELTRFLITHIGIESQTRNLLQTEYLKVSKDYISHEYDIKMAEDSLRIYKQKAEIYKESGFVYLTENEKDAELLRQIKRAETYAEYKYDYAFRYNDPVSPVKQANITQNIISEAKKESVVPTTESVVVKTKQCEVCHEDMPIDATVCEHCSNMEDK